jgi:hypothetical protein
MNELHLFAGAGGGILGGILLGHTPVCAVEIEPYCRKVLLQRQRDGILPKFPIWDDVTTFDGTPWRGKVDVVCGGFPCQDISIAGGGAGRKWPASLAKYDRDSRSWRTAQCLLFEDLGESLETFPNWGIMRGGECWEQTTLGQGINGRDCGLLGTPLARMWKYRKWWNRSKPMGNLDELPATNPEMYGHLAGKQMSLTWLEHHMIFPLGWTDREPLGIHKFQEWQHSHSKFLEGSSND